MGPWIRRYIRTIIRSCGEGVPFPGVGVAADRISGIHIEHEWSTARDEAVREDHRAFEDAGPQTLDFNYMTIVPGGGTLLFPSDMGGPAKQVINCRCLEVAVP